jgi:hypothetical protein
MMPGMAHARMRIVIVLAGLLVATAPALAAGSNMPWEQPLQQILQSDRGAGYQDHRGDHHHRDRSVARVR